MRDFDINFAAANDVQVFKYQKWPQSAHDLKVTQLCKYMTPVDLSHTYVFLDIYAKICPTLTWALLLFK